MHYAFLLYMSHRYCFRFAGSYAGFTGTSVTANGEFAFALETSPPDDSSCPDMDLLFSSEWFETGNEVFLDFDESGSITVGDMFLFHNNQLVVGTETGLVSGECIILPSSDSYCTISYTFGFGILTVQGMFDWAMSITGGTQCFYGVSGFLEGSVGDAEGAFSYQFIIDNGNLDSLNCAPNIFDEPWYQTESSTFLDYDANGEISQGDTTLFDYRPIVVGENGPVGNASGKCSVIQDPMSDISENSNFCSIIMFFGNGELVLQGFQRELTIVSGSGCFQGIQGVARVVNVGDRLEYTFELAE